MTFVNPRLGVALVAGSASAVDGDVVFSNSNGVTFGMQTSASSNVITMSLSGSGLGTAIQAFSDSAGAAIGRVTISNANALSFGVNGQTITASLPKMSYWTNFQAGGLSTAPNSSSASNLIFGREKFFFPIDATRADFFMNVSMANFTGTNGSYTLSLGVYTFAGSTAQSVSSASVAVSWSSGTNPAASQYGGQSAVRFRSLALGTWAFTPGDYLIGYMLSASVPAGSTVTLSFCANRGASEIAAGPALYFRNVGAFSTGTNAFPASIHMTNIVGAVVGPIALTLAGTF